MDFPKSVGFSMVVFFMVGFLCKSIIQVIMIFQAIVKFVKIHNYYKINFRKIIFFILCKQCEMRHNCLY